MQDSELVQVDLWMIALFRLGIYQKSLALEAPASHILGSYTTLTLSEISPSLLDHQTCWH